MIDRTPYSADLQKLLQRLEADLLQRSDREVPEVGRRLREEYERAKTAAADRAELEEWRADAITQAAVAWVLSCVFVRFLEDNRLIDPPKIAGPGERLERARDEHELFFRAQPDSHRPRVPAGGLRRAGEACPAPGPLRRAQPDPRPAQLAVAATRPGT